MAWTIFHKFMENQHNGTKVVDLDTDTLKVMLVTAARAPVQATDEDMVTIDNTEVAGTNYTAGGATTANESVALAVGVVTFDLDDITWLQHAAGFTDARYAVMYESTGVPANDVPICFADLGGNKGNVDGDLTLQMDAAGVFTITCA